MEARRTEMKDQPRSFDMPRPDERSPMPKIEPKLVGNFSSFTPPKGFEDIPPPPEWNHSHIQNSSTSADNQTTPTMT